MVGAVFLTVKSGSLQINKGKRLEVYGGSRRVGGISMNSCLDRHKYRWLHIEILVNMCIQKG